MSGSRRPSQGFVGIDVSRDKFDDCGIRRIIWLMTTQVIRCCGLFRAYYQKRQEGWTALQKGRLATAVVNS